MQNWVNWWPGIQHDSSVKLQYSEIKSGEGAAFSWISSDYNTGSGKISIISDIHPDSLQVLIDYGKNGKSTSKFILQKVGLNTRLSWRLESDLGINPLTRWFGLFTDQMTGPDIEKGLNNLARLLDGNRTQNGFEIVEIEIPARILLSVRDTASTATVSSKMAQMFNHISKFLKTKHLTPIGPPMTIFHAFSSTSIDIESCIPISSTIATPSDIRCYESKSQNSLMIRYNGSYYQIAGAYSAIQAEIKERGIDISGSPWEEYISDPGLAADSNTIYTNVYYPVIQHNKY